MTILAETLSVSVSFADLRAVDSVSLEVAGGEVVGLLGANGAGKTTLIRLLLGRLRPSSGDVRLLGRSPDMAGRRHVGYVPQSLGLYADLTAKENWEFSAAAFGTERHGPLPPDVDRWADELVGDLPLGAQRRVAFAVALSHHPGLLVLDEPTSGVGPLGRARLWHGIRTAAEDGAGVLVTTHNLEEAEECDRLVIMATGRVLADGTLRDVTEGHAVVEVASDDRNGTFRALDAAGLPVQAHGESLRVTASPAQVVAALEAARISGSVRLVPASLEEAFVELVAAGGSS